MLSERRIVCCSGPPFKRFLNLLRGLALLGLILQSGFVLPLRADALELELARPDDTYSLGVNVDLVNLNVIVHDGHGTYLPNVQKQDFKVYEDGVQQTITHFSAEDSPASVALLLDTGTCVLPGSYEERLNIMKSHALRFVRLLRPLDEVMVISFGTEVRMEAKLTRDKPAVEEAIQQIPPNGRGTQLYRTVAAGLELMKREKKSRKVMVLFSFGGVDIPSMLTNRDGRSGVLRFAEEADVTVHPISLPPDRTPGRRDIDFWQFSPQDTYLWEQMGGSAEFPGMKHFRLGPVILESLAAVTGGTYYWGHSWDQYEEHLTNALARIAAELGRQYGIAYVSGNRDKEGKFRKVKVELSIRGAKAQTRRGYFSKPTQENSPSPLLERILRGDHSAQLR